MPMGCGEQNVARLFPNVLIYDYLSRFKPGLPLVLVRISVWVCLSGVRWALSKDPIDMDVRLNLLNNIRDGYKRHVGNFLNVDGSFSVFKWATTGQSSLDTDGDRPSFTFVSQMDLFGELWTGSGLDINQYWEQRDACDQSNLLVGCFNNEYASSWLTGRFSKRSLILIG